MIRCIHIDRFINKQSTLLDDASTPVYPLETTTTGPTDTLTSETTPPITISTDATTNIMKIESDPSLPLSMVLFLLFKKKKQVKEC